ncbi:ATP-binding cassette sub- G member 2 [Cladochytrium tenue]|nr:ATP-binding cassette sub- G member 2 [Cladochytrium tenue]
MASAAQSSPPLSPTSPAPPSDGAAAASHRLSPPPRSLSPSLAATVAAASVAPAVPPERISSWLGIPPSVPVPNAVAAAPAADGRPSSPFLTVPTTSISPSPPQAANVAEDLNIRDYSPLPPIEARPLTPTGSFVDLPFVSAVVSPADPTSVDSPRRRSTSRRRPTIATRRGTSVRRRHTGDAEADAYRSGDSAGSLPRSRPAHVLAWDELCCDIPLPKKKKAAGEHSKKESGGVRRVLDGISGSVASGEMLAIMGSSGAGKTTLLNCLSGRLEAATKLSEGTITYDGAPRDARLWRRVAAFVEQDDALRAQLTVRETVAYAARLRLPAADLRPAEKLAVADAMIRNLRLARCADSRVGDDDARGVSGGERKRTAIAQELVGCPDILFLDEPTSGLDSSSAVAVIETLRRDAVHSGRIVVATIHQPSWALLSLFDKVVFLAAGGVAYFGPPRAAARHFARLGHKVPANQNPADFFMDLLTVDHSKTEEDIVKDLERVARIKAAYKYRPDPAHALPGTSFSVINTAAAAADAGLSSKKDSVDATAAAAAAAMAEVEPRATSFSTIVATPAELPHEPELDSTVPVVTAVDPEVSKKLTAGADAATALDLEAGDRTAAGLPRSVTLDRWANSWFSEFRVLMERTALETVRDRSFLVAGLVRSIAVLILIGFSYFRLRRDQPGINDRVGVLFFWPVNLIFTTITPVVLTFPLERTVMKRERAAGAYRVSTFFLTKLIASCAVTTVFALVGSVPLYFMLGLRLDTDPAMHFFAWVLAQWLTTMVATAVGLTVGAAVRSQKVAQVAGPLSTVVFLLYGGGLTNFHDIAYPFAIFKWISPVAYAFRANMINEFSGLNDFSCNGAATPTSCITNGDAVLAYYSADDIPYGTSVGALVALFAGFSFLAYLLLLLLHKPRSSRMAAK